MPIGDMLLRSVDDTQINTVFPKTFEEYKNGIRKKMSSLLNQYLKLYLKS